MRASVINRFAKNITVAQDTVWTRRGRRLALVVPLAAVAAVGLVGCNNPQHGTNAAPTAQPSVPTSAPATPSVSPTFSATPTAPTSTPTATSASPTKQVAVVKLNGTAHNGLTISNGTRYVVMDGKLVDFGTPVRDLAWSPDGRKAASIDGAGDLVVSNPDGSGKVVVAKNPGGQTWSHPTWRVRAANELDQQPARNDLFFISAQGGASRLENISATAVNGTPVRTFAGGPNGLDTPAIPYTGYQWSNAGGGKVVFDNTDDGQVYIYDDYLRMNIGGITKGAEPALSAEDEVVFVRSVGGHDHLFEWDLKNQTAKDLTPHATTDYTEPAFSPDGKTIAVRTPDGIATLPADGSAAPTRISDYTGLPAYRG